MKPQSKITVFMVVMIVMLSIYYFNMDKDTGDVGNQTPNTQNTFSYEEFDTLRTQMTEDRQTLVSQLQTVLVSADVTVEEKNQAIETIQTISTMSTNEYTLERNIKQMGYLDVLVQSDSNSVVITVLASELSAEESNDLRVMAKTLFGASYDVPVSFVPPADNY